MNKQILVTLTLSLLIVFTSAVIYLLITDQDDSQLVSEPISIENEQQNLDIKVQDLPIDKEVVGTKDIQKEVDIKETPLQTGSRTENQTLPVSETKKSISQDTSLLTFGKISAGSVFVIYQSATVEPKQIPFKVMTHLDSGSVSSYQYCISILAGGVRASETDCTSLNKNLNIDTKIGITDLNLAPYPLAVTYPDGDSYLSVGDNQLEIVVALIKNDPSLIYKITGDTSATMSILEENAIVVEKTGTFTLSVKK